MKIEAENSCKMLGTACHTTRHRKAEFRDMNVHHCDSISSNNNLILTAVSTVRQTKASCWSVGDTDGSLSFSLCESCMKMINITCRRAHWVPQRVASVV